MRVGIVGCGIVGAAIAYTLSQHTDWQITVWDQRAPEQWEATGAALGILMAVLRTKLKGKHLRLGLASLRAYEQLIPELEAITGLVIPYNRRGILQLCFAPQDLVYWQKTQAVRRRQGFVLDLLDREQLMKQFPQLAVAHQDQALAVGAVYSPDDRQLEPTIVAQALIQAATQKGVTFHWRCPVEMFWPASGSDCPQQITRVETVQGQATVDIVIVAAGLGSQPLTQALQAPIAMEPVLGQAFWVKDLPLPQDSPVINGNGLHLYPRWDGSWGIGATVEFPVGSEGVPSPDPELFEHMRLSAIALYPPLAQAEILRCWSGLRPRPDGRAAPIIEILPGYQNVIAATGHYRNGVLMAPITAAKVLELARTIETG